MRLYVIKIPKLINGEIFGLRGVMGRRSLALFKEKHELEFELDRALSYTINFDGVDSYLFQGVRFDKLHESPRISYFPILTEDNFLYELTENIQKRKINLFVEMGVKTDDYIKDILPHRLAGTLHQMPTIKVLNFIDDLLTLAESRGGSSGAKPVSPRA